MTNTIKVAFRSFLSKLMLCYSRFSGMLICLVLLVSIFTSSCNGPNKSDPPKDSSAVQQNEPKTSPATQPVIDTTDGDPAFVLTRDTISTYGPHSITRNILQDKNGNYWLASWEGIIRYDGKVFTNFTLKEGLGHWHVFSLLEDKSGNIWFGTIGGGVYRYNPSVSPGTGAGFTHFTTADGLAGNTIMCMMEDKAGNIWLGTGGNGVSRYDGHNFTSFAVKDGLSNNFVSCIAQDKTGKLWLGTDVGINLYEPAIQASLPGPGGKSFTDFTHQEGISFHRVRSIIEDKNGNIWIGSQEGLHRYDGKSLTNIRTSYTSIICEDKAGNLWMNDGGTDNHRMVLYRYNPYAAKAAFTEFLVRKDPQPPFLNQIFGIIEDRDGNIWFGNTNGVCRFDGKSFTNFTGNASK